MPSVDLVSRLSYQGEVNRLMLDRGRRTGPVLTVAEMAAMRAAYDRGDSPSVFAATLPDRSTNLFLMPASSTPRSFASLSDEDRADFAAEVEWGMI